jgi:hypothetical protein
MAKRPVLKAGDRVGPWTVSDFLGSGGNGEVWIATRPDVDRVALKMIPHRSGERYERFRSEVQWLTRHSGVGGVIPLLDAYAPTRLTNKERGWIAMPIATRVADGVGSPPELPLAVRHVAEAAATLAELAQEGSYHRDLKPDNLLVLDRHCVLADFGLVAYPDRPPLTADDRPLGAFGFMADEMKVRPADADPGPADVWSLAKTLWCLAVERAYPPEGPFTTDHSLTGHGVSGQRAYQLDPILIAATRYAPTDRLSMRDFASELNVWLAPLTAPEVQPLSLEGLSRTIAAVTAPAAARDSAHMEAVRETNRLWRRFEEPMQELNRALATVAIDAGFGSSTKLTDRFDGLRSLPGAPIYHVGTMIHRRGPEPMPVAFYGGIVAELLPDNRVRLMVGWALEHFDGRKRLAWSDAADVLPATASEDVAIRLLAARLSANLPAAVAEFLQLLEEWQAQL